MRTRILWLTALCGMLCAVPAFAEGNLGLKKIGPTLSYVTPEDLDGVVGFGVLADLGRIGGALGLDATADFWSKSEGSGSLEVKFQDISFGGRAMYHFPVQNPKIDPAVGAGVALHFLRSEVDEVVINGVTFGGSDTETKFGFDLAGEVVFAVNETMDVVGQMGYRVVEDFGQFTIGAGLLFGIGGGGSAGGN